MKKIQYLTTIIATLCLAQGIASAQPATPAPGSQPAMATPQTDPVSTQLNKLVQKIRTKLKAGENTEASFKSELKQFDQIVANNPKASPDELAHVVLLKAMLYLQVFNDTTKGTALLKEIKAKYPTSKMAGEVDMLLKQVAQQAAAKKIQNNLKPGSEFPDFQVKSLDGKPLSVAALKGKVVMIDFWATWCPPCRAEMPNVIATYKKYHAKGFDIIGVSLDSNRAKLESFLKNHKGMSWPQFFDGNGWNNELAKKYGVQSIPFSILVGPNGKIIATGVRGEKLGETVGQALAKK